MSTPFHVALSGQDGTADPTEPLRWTVARRLILEEPSEGFGLIEPTHGGWALCIPDGAEAEVRLGDTPLDVLRLAPDPSGERRIELRAGLSAHVRMGDFWFDVRPADGRPAHDEPAHVELAHDEPAHVELAHVEPADGRPADIDPAALGADPRGAGPRGAGHFGAGHFGARA